MPPPSLLLLLTSIPLVWKKSYCIFPPHRTVIERERIMYILFGESNNSDIVIKALMWLTSLAVYVYSLQLYKHRSIIIRM
jgi:hypothetical protein